MRILDGQRLFSASDLVGYAACAHLTQLELAAVRGEVERPERSDPLLDLLSRRGLEHEAEVLERFDDDSVVTIDAETRTVVGLEAAADATIEAMRAGAALIYQATFLHGGWVGHADFLERVDTPSTLGEWSYEVSDAKLARSVKASAILQLCDYSAHVTRIQGRDPQHIHVDTGDGEHHTLRLADYTAYYRRLRAEFTGVVTAKPGARQTYPDPVEHCSVCRWAEVCSDRRRADDHLSLVAGMRGDQIRKLADIGVETMQELACTPADATCPGISPVVHRRLRNQAALQVRGDGCIPPLWEPIEDDPAESTNDDTRFGLRALPAPTPGDLFLDLEGDPYALDGGLEYLFGIVEVVGADADGRPQTAFHEFWAHTRDEERLAFERAVDLIVDRRTRVPGMHVYHYASYEQTAFKRLMGAHGTREHEIDDLLRHEVFVDLYRVVKQAVMLSTESYSLKKVEQLYMQRAAGAVMDAGSSIVAYEDYLADHDPARLTEIGAYNRDDCESLVGLRDWLEIRRVELVARSGVSLERPLPLEATAAPDDHAGDLGARLVAAATTPESALLGSLLAWHRREAKPEWWKFFSRVREYEPDEFVDDGECIGGLHFVEEVGPVVQSIEYRFAFEPQDHKFSVGNKPCDPSTEDQAGTITAISEGEVSLKRGKKRAGEPFPEALLPSRPLTTNVQRAALAEIGEWVLDHGIDGAGPYRSARDLLLRLPPRGVGRSDDAALVAVGESTLDAARRITEAMDGGCLAIQGPPGAGKTYTGARVISRLLARGRTIGVTATTHSAISNLLAAVAQACSDEGVDLHAIQRVEDGWGCDADGIDCSDDSKGVESALIDRTYHLGAGTAWLWCREGLRDAVDYLVVDEAGQMSLADVIASSTSARNLVLLGDPQQLSQPSKGTHPPGAGASALEHLLGGHATIPADLGLFLDTTWRMHPEVCRYVSEIAYEGRLQSEERCARQRVDDGAGLWWVPVDHAGDRVRSTAEAEVVRELVDRLVGAPWLDENGCWRPLKATDLIVVAPYNAHVAELRAALPDDVPVGTVDKFQGREGAVAIYSMASSSVEDAPRGMRFLYDLHRLNVAVSRARARAYIVASPQLLRVLCHNPDELRLANALCRFVELAHGPVL